MPDFALDYGLLHEAKKDLYDLADRIGPQLEHSPFSEVVDKRTTPAHYDPTSRFALPDAYFEANPIFGDLGLSLAFRNFFRRAEGPMKTAAKDLRELGDVFGSVADAVFDTDAQMAESLGAMGAGMGLDRWKSDRAAWEYRQAHADECVPGPDGSLPPFCSAQDPGPPPTDQTITTPNGSVTTHLTLDGDHNVVREDTTVEHGGQRYSSTTTYTDGGKAYTTETTWADGSRTTDATTVGANGSTVTASTGPDGKVTRTVVMLNETGAGTKTVTGPGGATTTYTRGDRREAWRPRDEPSGHRSSPRDSLMSHTNSGPKGP